MKTNENTNNEKTNPRPPLKKKTNHETALPSRKHVFLKRRPHNNTQNTKNINKTKILQPIIQIILYNPKQILIVNQIYQLIKLQQILIWQTNSLPGKEKWEEERKERETNWERERKRRHWKKIWSEKRRKRKRKNHSLSFSLSLSLSLFFSLPLFLSLLSLSN